VRALLAVALGSLAALAGCGEGAERRVSRDVTSGEPAAEGCVVPGPGGEAVRTWRVERGESLARIARRAYGDEALWREIAAANAGRVGAQGQVAAGTVLVIPWAGR